jgi:hypothetical protein
MKALLREYLASLKEREELDAILPDLLSELGFHVYSRPGRGTAQYGVDIAAVGKHDDGERKVFLFSVKRGDLDRSEWNAGEQSLQASLDDIITVYIPTHIPKAYQELKVVICPTFGGEVTEPVRLRLTQYEASKTTERISFEEWDGDRLAGLLQQGILREEVLPKGGRSAFQKAVAMLDEPDVSYRHFRRLLDQLRQPATAKVRDRLRSVRQMYLCLWILFVWGRDVDNVEAPYRASELVLLNIWQTLKPDLSKTTKDVHALKAVFGEALNLHLVVATDFLDRKIIPAAGVEHGLSMAVGANSSLDINLALFEALGRLSLTGLWCHWLNDLNPAPEHAVAADRLLAAAVAMVENNPSLALPRADRQATDVALFLVLWIARGGHEDRMRTWLGEMLGRLNYAVRRRSYYPTVFADYRALANHPRDGGDDYFRRAMAASTFIPLLAAFVAAALPDEAWEVLRRLIAEALPDCTLQLWLPDAASEVHLYLNSAAHGRALHDLPISADPKALFDQIIAAIASAPEPLSAVKARQWPLVLTAVRHYRLPVPPQYWIEAVSPGKAETV